MRYLADAPPRQSVTGSALAAAVVVGLGIATPTAAAVSAAGAADGVAPTELRVVCHGNHIRLATSTVTATSAGVVISVTRTNRERRRPVSVDARSNQPSRWLLDAARPPYPVPDRGDSTKIVTLPPGPARVSCGYDAAGQLRQRTTRRIRIVDPNGYWRPGTLESNGCRPSGIPSWAIGPRQGRTAHQAVERLVQSVRDLERPEERGEATLTARPLAAGYPDAREQAWLILRDGAASISVRVAPTVPRRGGNAAFTAFPDLPCSQ